MRRLPPVFCVGLPGSGKSTAVRQIRNRLSEDGYRVSFFSDKFALEREVLRDTDRRHSVLLRNGPKGQRQMVLLDGISLNRAHERILRLLSQVRDQQSRCPDIAFLVEWAYGADVDYGPSKEPIRQSASQFVGWLFEHRLLDDSLVLDIQSDLEVRLARNNARPDQIPPDEFIKLFPDEGRFTSEDRSWLGERYVGLSNPGEELGPFLVSVDRAYERMILPLIRGEGQAVFREHHRPSRSIER